MTPSPSRESAVAPLQPAARNGHLPNHKVNILLVDDRDDKLLALEAVVSSLGQNVITARSGKDALRQLLHHDFAVILLDVSMPGMDGFETAAMIRKRPQSEHTPIIFVTSLSNRENHIAQGYSLGAVDYILSPIVPEVLRTKVSVFVELYKKTEQIREQGERLRLIEEAEHRRQLADAVDRLEAETKRNRFFTMAVDMLAIADFNGHFLQLNPTWEKVLGFSEAELKASRGLELVHPEDHANMSEKLCALKRGETTYFEGRYQRKDGSFRWLGWTAAPFSEEQLIYIFARDITERKEAEHEIYALNQQLSRRINELVDINKELEAFSYSISHDLRAPLRAMQGFAHTLLHEYGARLDEDGRDYAKRIVNSSMYMDTLLHDLLDYSRLSRSQMETAPMLIEPVISEILAQMDKEIASRKAEIEVKRPLLEVSAHLPTIRQVLSNLITNALKFIPPDAVPKITIATEQSGSCVRVKIQDNGIGIDSEYHDQIFRLFERLHSQHEYPGTGVGLALVRKGVERMGGRVGLESRKGAGSCFWFELPAAEAVAQLD